MTTILTTSATSELSATSEGESLWVTASDLTNITGYELKPEGFCKGDLCIPVPPGREAELLRESDEATAIDLAAFWRYLDAAVVHDESGDTGALGEPPDDRGLRLDSLEAPDFTLPDAAGTLHSLSDYRGQKVLLAAWASW